MKTLVGREGPKKSMLGKRPSSAPRSGRDMPGPG